jgi:site-specific DNA recombinase
VEQAYRLLLRPPAGQRTAEVGETAPRDAQYRPYRRITMHDAIYARVSTARQERDQTIDSQLAALQSWVQQQGYDLLPEHCFTDEGYSGARLDRPGLDRLRDAAREGGFAVLAILSPDRLARKYAYQVLLLEEFRRLGCPVVFLQHPISDDPNDQRSTDA